MSPALRRAARVSGCVLSVLLGACGGGGDSATPATAQSIVAPVPTSTAGLTISAFTPASGGSGATVTVSGTGLAGVTSARLGGVDATFRAGHAGAGPIGRRPIDR